MDEAASDSAVAVHERVDRLELRMSDGGLSHRRQVIAVDEVDEVGHQRRDTVLRGRDVAGVRRVASTATDPALLVTEPPGPDASGFIGHERAVDRFDARHRQIAAARGLLDGFLHGQHVRGHRTSAALAGTRVDEGTSQVPLADLDAFDPARGDGFGSEEERTDGLESLDPILGVQVSDGGLRPRDEIGRLEAHGRANRGVGPGTKARYVND